MDPSKSQLVANSNSTKRTPSPKSRKNQSTYKKRIRARDTAKMHWNTLKETIDKTKVNGDVGTSRKVDFEFSAEQAYAKNLTAKRYTLFAEEVEDTLSIDSTSSKQSSKQILSRRKESSNITTVARRTAPKSFRYHVVVKHSPTLQKRPDFDERLYEFEANLWRKTFDSMGGLSSREGLDFKGGLSCKGGLNAMSGMSSLEGLSKMKGCQTRESIQVGSRPLSPYHCGTRSKFSLLPEPVKKSCVSQPPLPPIRHIDCHYACAAIGKDELPVYKRKAKGLSLPRIVPKYVRSYSATHYLPMSTVNIRWPATGSNQKKYTKPSELLDEKNLCSFMKSFGPVNLIIKKGSKSSMVVFELMHSAYDARHYAHYPLGVTCDWANVQLNNHGHLIKYFDYKLSQDEEWVLSIKAMDPATKKKIFSSRQSESVLPQIDNIQMYRRGKMSKMNFNYTEKNSVASSTMSSRSHAL